MATDQQWRAAMDRFAADTVIGMPDVDAASNGRIMADIWKRIRHADWIAPEEAPNHTWGWVLWGSPTGTGRMVALGARDGAWWRADGYTVPAGRGDWLPLQWCPIGPPEPPDM